MSPNRPSVVNAFRPLISGSRAAATFIFGCSLLAAATTAGNVFAAEPAFTPAEAARAPIKIENIEQAPSIDRGTTTFHFKVNEPAGTRFYVSYQHRDVRGGASTNHVWQIEGDKGAEVELSFGYRSEYNGDRSVSPLESSEEMLEYRVNVKGCIGSPGLVTIVSAPLYRTPPEERQMFLPKSSTDDGALTADGARRLLLAVPKLDAAEQGKSTDLGNREPCTELIIGFHKDPPSAKPDPLQHLFANWSRQSQEVGAAHIKYRMLRTGGSSFAPLSQARVNEILSAVDLDNHPENFADTAQKLLSVDAREKPIFDKPWAEGEFFMLGLRTHDQLSSFIRVYDGEWDFNYSVPNNQISVHRAGESSMARTTLGEFRIRPPDITNFKPDLKLLPSGDAVLSSSAGGNSSTQWTAVPSTGFIRRSSFVFESKPSSEAQSAKPNRTARDEFQYAPKTYPGRIVFPSLLIKTRYSNDKLTSLEMLLIDSAEFNDSIQKNQLELAAPANAKVFLFNKAPVKQPKFLALPKDISDVAGFLHDQKFLPADSSEDSP